MLMKLRTMRTGMIIANDSITEDEGDEDSDSYDDELHESKLVASK